MKPVTRRELLRYSMLGGLGATLAACAPAAAPTQAPESTQASVVSDTAVPATQAPAKAVTLTYYLGFGGGALPEQVEAVKKLFDKFSGANPNVKVEPMVVAWEEAPRKFQAMVAAGTPPDVITMGMSQWDFAAKGAFVDVRPLIDADGIDMADWEPTAIEAYTVVPKNNMLYGLPSTLSAQLMVINKAIWEKNGLKPPTDWKDASWTWDAYLEAARKMTHGSNGNIDEWGTLRSPGGNWHIPWMYGGNWVSDDLTKITLDSPECIKAFAFVQDEVYKHHVAPSDAESQALANGFLSGKVAMNDDGTWTIATLLEAEDLDWDLAPLPFAEELGVDKPRALPYYPDSLVISSKSAVAESWSLIKFLILDDANYKDFCGFMSAIPARKKLRSWYYDVNWRSKAPDKNWSIVENVWDYAQVVRLFLNINWSEANNTQEADLGALWTNDATPDQVIPALAKKLEDIWQRGNEQMAAQ